MVILFSDLCEKEVINCNDGTLLGNVSDIEISTEECKVTALFVECKKSIIGKSERIRIPWDKIEKLGVDVIIVNVCHTSVHEKCHEKTKHFIFK